MNPGPLLSKLREKIYIFYFVFIVVIHIFGSYFIVELKKKKTIEKIEY